MTRELNSIQDDEETRHTHHKEKGHGHRQRQEQLQAAGLEQLHPEPGVREYKPWPLWHGKRVSQRMTESQGLWVIA
jgi:hypothetical protein